MWSKHVGAVYNKSKNTVQLVRGEICVCGTVQDNFTLKNEEQMVITGRSEHDDLSDRKSAAEKAVYFRRRV
jgi:hypothetical protein